MCWCMLPLHGMVEKTLQNSSRQCFELILPCIRHILSLHGVVQKTLENGSRQCFWSYVPLCLFTGLTHNRQARCGRWAKPCVLWFRPSSSWLWWWGGPRIPPLTLWRNSLACFTGPRGLPSPTLPLVYIFGGARIIPYLPTTTFSV